jgi:hypothetical protein
MNFKVGLRLYPELFDEIIINSTEGSDLIRNNRSGTFCAID